MSLKAKRTLVVSLVILTAFSLGLALISMRGFSIAGWLLLSLQVELGILVFALLVIGIIVGYGWALTADAHKSFLAYLKFIYQHVLE